MSKQIPPVSGEEAIAAFCKAGYMRDRIRGSHHILKRQGKRFHLSIPVHRGKTVGDGLLKKQIKAADMTIEEFLALL